MMLQLNNVQRLWRHYKSNYLNFDLPLHVIVFWMSSFSAHFIYKVYMKCKKTIFFKLSISHIHKFTQCYIYKLFPHSYICAKYILSNSHKYIFTACKNMYSKSACGFVVAIPLLWILQLNSFAKRYVLGAFHLHFVMFF